MSENIGKFIMLSFLLVSCNTHKLKEEHSVWQPYFIGQKLVFESDSGKVLAFQVEDIERKMVTTDPLAFFPQKGEVIKVHINTVGGRGFDILTIRSKRNGANISFGTRSNEFWFYSNMGFSLDSLNSIGHSKVFEVKYSDSGNLNFSKRLNAIETIYWSQTKGLEGFKKFDGSFWTVRIE